MTDGEKKAIKDCDTIFICLEDMMSEESANDYRKSYLTLTNLIEKQSKEIEELRNEVMEKELIIDGMKEDRRIAVEEIQEQYYISKDKIKEILGIEENIDNEKLLSLLQTIVDENARLEDIEDRKVQIEYNNVFNKGVKSVEDKIKARIKELEEYLYKGNIKDDFLMIRIKAKIQELQSLLEKE